MPKYKVEHPHLPCLQGWDHNMVEGGQGVLYCSRCNWVPTRPGAKPRRLGEPGGGSSTINLSKKSTGQRRAVRIIERDGDRCHYCGVALGTHNRTIDHVIPRSKGGTNTISNWVLACRRCNSVRGDMDYRAFISLHGVFGVRREVVSSSDGRLQVKVKHGSSGGASDQSAPGCGQGCG